MSDELREAVERLLALPPDAFNRPALIADCHAVAGAVKDLRGERDEDRMKFADLQTYVRSVVPLGVINSSGRWRYEKRLNSDGGWDDRTTWRHGKKLLLLFAPPCRGWSNPQWCPPTPFGDYHWAFSVQMVTGVIRASKAFRMGVRFGRDPSEPFRDANPFGSFMSNPSRRGLDWDRGYILGLHWDNVSQWLAKMGCRVR